jgi:hypothetical protein
LKKAGAVPRLLHLKVFRLSNSKKKERAFLAPPQEAGPLRTSLYELFRDLGSGRPPPAGLTLNLLTILAKRAFGSEGVALRESAAAIYQRRRRTDDTLRRPALVPGGRPQGDRTTAHPRASGCVRFRRHPKSLFSSRGRPALCGRRLCIQQTTLCCQALFSETVLRPVKTRSDGVAAAGGAGGARPSEVLQTRREGRYYVRAGRRGFRRGRAAL